MSTSHQITSKTIAVGLALVAVLGIAGCSSAGADASGPTTAPPPPSSTAAPIETTSPTPEPVAIDPADVTTWVITTDGMGPITRGASYTDVIAGLPEFEASEWCPWVDGLTAEGSGSFTLIHAEGDQAITAVWIIGRAGESGVVPASPSTEAGIRLGSTMDELAAAYPALETVNQVGPESFGYAVGDDANGYLDFLVENDQVVLIGAQDVAGVPKEFCG